MRRSPEAPWNPAEATAITPADFERLVTSWLRETAAADGHSITPEHLGVAHGSGGEYKIDVLVQLEFVGAMLTILVECKHQRRPVEREDVMVLEAKLRDVRAHKGMLFSTSGFQKGAVAYAAAHNIATAHRHLHLGFTSTRLSVFL